MPACGPRQRRERIVQQLGRESTTLIDHGQGHTAIIRRVPCHLDRDRVRRIARLHSVLDERCERLTQAGRIDGHHGGGRGLIDVQRDRCAGPRVRLLQEALKERGESDSLGVQEIPTGDGEHVPEVSNGLLSQCLDVLRVAPPRVARVEVLREEFSEVRDRPYGVVEIMSSLAKGPANRKRPRVSTGLALNVRLQLHRAPFVSVSMRSH